MVISLISHPDVERIVIMGRRHLYTFPQMFYTEYQSRTNQTKETEFMYITCLDLEGVLVPEIWIAFAEASGIPELKRTTRDEPDYDKLMKWRIGVLKEHGLGLKEIQDTIEKIDPMPGAKEFLDELRSFCQVIIISDTFTQFATPLMKKLGWPTIFCNSLEVAENGEITGFKMRIEQSKLTTVKALQSIGYDTIASGDSYNDLGMIQASKAGFLFRSTDKIKADYPELPAFETYDELMAAIRKAMA
jgi:phosphoserine/homoserine phosphotransferase